MTKTTNLVKWHKKCPFGSAIWLATNSVLWHGIVWYKKCHIGYLVGYRSPSEVYSMQRRPDHLMALIIFNVTQLQLQEIPEQLVAKRRDE